ncbi:MAG: divergent PAP2 family protein [Candidatus Kerfeldbacteria bacterium]|nr:divergent PAP2 family protein [Candidatus Kerfeldbacteria bacterium]
MLPHLVLIPLVAGIGTQVIKFIIQIVRGEFAWSRLQEYGGMPSAHTAFVVSLAVTVGLHLGWDSAEFAISLIFALLIIRDAIGLRQFLSQHGKILNMLIKDLPDDVERKYPHHLEERFGHTPLQALVGGLIGLVVALWLHDVVPDWWP